MIGRLLVVAGGIAAGAVAAAAVWTKRKAELDAEASEAGGSMPPTTSSVRPTEVGLTPLRSTEGTGPPALDGADDLQTVKGIGRVSEQRLHDEDVTTFAQIAAWSEEDVDAIGATIKVSPERIRHEDWVGQARAITEGQSRDT